MRIVAALATLALAGNAAAQTLTLAPEELVGASSSYSTNQRPRVLFTDDGSAHLVWVAGNVFGEEIVLHAVRPPAGAYGAAAPVSSTTGVRTGFADGLTFRRNGSVLLATWEGLDFLNRPVLYARSTDAGVTWEPEERSDPATLEERAYAGGGLWPDGRVTQCWMVYEEGTGIPDLVWTGQDAQGAFAAPSYPATTSPDVPCECCNPDQLVLDDGTVLVAYRNNEGNNQRRAYVARSTDGGATFPLSTRVDTGNWWFPACPGSGPSLAAEGQNVLVAWKKAPGSVHHIWSSRSTDGGATWLEMGTVDDSDGATSVDHPEIAMRGSFAVAAWTGKDPVTQHPEMWIAASTDAGATWGPSQMLTGDGVNRPIGQATVDISLAGEVEVAWYDQRDQVDRIYRRAGGLATTGVEVPATAGLRLSARPNPFTASTELRAGTADVRFEILDVAGRLVRRLEGSGGAARWDGRDEAGGAVSPGVYFARTVGVSQAEGVRLVRLR